MEVLMNRNNVNDGAAWDYVNVTKYFRLIREYNLEKNNGDRFKGLNYTRIAGIETNLKNTPNQGYSIYRVLQDMYATPLPMRENNLRFKIVFKFKRGKVDYLPMGVHINRDGMVMISVIHPDKVDQYDYILTPSDIAEKLEQFLENPIVIEYVGAIPSETSYTTLNTPVYVRFLEDWQKHTAFPIGKMYAIEKVKRNKRNNRVEVIL